MVQVGAACTFSRGFLRGSCGESSDGQCVYCGEPFCNEHGIHGEDYAQICNRPKCRAKYDDVQAHQEWILRVRAANDVMVCAIEGCRERMQHECGRCRLQFCIQHLKPMQITERLRLPPQKVTVVLCAHCQSRRRLWDD
jgi:hypothetical protein